MREWWVYQCSGCHRYVLAQSLIDLTSAMSYGSCLLGGCRGHLELVNDPVFDAVLALGGSKAFYDLVNDGSSG